MKQTNHKWIITLGLATALALPGMAMADGWKRPPQKFPSHQYQQNDQHHRYHRDSHRGRDYARRGDHRRHEWREHHRYRHFDRDDYREHEWREHHHYHRYYGRPAYYGYRVYPGAYWSGFVASPSLGLVIDLH